MADIIIMHIHFHKLEGLEVQHHLTLKFLQLVDLEVEMHLLELVVMEHLEEYQVVYPLQVHMDQIWMMNGQYGIFG